MSRAGRLTSSCSSQSTIRLRAMNRLTTLFSWRFQILSQDYIPDRTRRRPFRIARRPIAFVASDVGSSFYTPRERPDETKLQIGASLPPELRKRVLELGWAASQGEDTTNTQKWEQAPISLLPLSELDALGSGTPNSAGRSDDGSGDEGPRTSNGLLRRKSSASNSITGIKKRAIFVPSLLAMFPVVADMIQSSDIAVSAAARDLILTLMRDDPSLLARPILEDISDSMKDTAHSLTTLQTFLHARDTLPPALAHHIFNHLAGYLKMVVRQTGADSGLGFSLCLPVMAELAPQVGDFSLRELRRNKLEGLILPSFTPMPTAALDRGTSALLPVGTVHTVMTRTAQTILLFQLLRQSPKDVNGVRESYAQLPILTIGEGTGVRPQTLSDFVPSKVRVIRSKPEQELYRLASSLDRSYLLLVTQIFKCLNRHLSDRTELAKFMDGINGILLSRGDDVGVVSHALIGE